MWNSLWNTIDPPPRSAHAVAVLCCLPSKPILAHCYRASTAAPCQGIPILVSPLNRIRPPDTTETALITSAKSITINSPATRRGRSHPAGLLG